MCGHPDRKQDPARACRTPRGGCPVPHPFLWRVGPPAPLPPRLPVPLWQGPQAPAGCRDGGPHWPGRQNRGAGGWPAGCARSCQSDRLSLTSREPHTPRWPPFKEQLIILNARPHAGAAAALPAVARRAAGCAGGSCSESWKPLICVSAQLAGRGFSPTAWPPQGAAMTSQLWAPALPAQGAPGGEAGCASSQCCLPGSGAARAMGFWKQFP